MRSLLDWGQPSGYETRPPSSRTALDAIPSGEWTSQLPEGLGGGEVPLFADERVAWLLAQVDVAGLRVLELGPLEGGHSYMLQRAGAQQVVAVEANRRAFLRCLAVQAALGLDRVEFLCGDFVGYLRALDRRFDLVVASGVLYHARDPVELLGLLGDASDRLFVWTHYYDRELLPRHLLERFDEEGPPYRYAYGSKARSFCGGGAAHSYWLDRPTIERTLQGLGYQLQVAFEEPGHVNGPALALLALR